MDSGFHHLRTRRRVYQHLERYPSRSGLKRFLDKIMYAVALGSPLVLLPQVAAIFINKNAAGFYAPTWFLFIILHALWVTYGTLHREWPVVLSHATLSLLNVAILVGIALY